MAKADLSPEYVRRLFSFDGARGVLIWNHRPVTDFKDGKFSAARIAARWNGQYAGKVAGSRDRLKYRKISIDDVTYLAHRLIWLHVTGEWPKDEIDHIHGVSAGDSLSNLRDATNLENRRNQKLPKNNTSGTIGVTWNKLANKWFAKICVGDNNIHLGMHSDKADAIAARKAAEIQYGFHANHGRVISKG